MFAPVCRYLKINKCHVFCSVGYLKQIIEDKLTDEYYSHIAVSDQYMSLLATSHLRLGCVVWLAVMLLCYRITRLALKCFVNG